MRPFEVEGTKYIRINGKSFFLLRAYTIRYDKFLFVQVFGRAALTKDDLPEKNWEIVTTKGAEGKIYTAWKPGFFDGSNETRLFVGASTEGSLRLLLAHHAPQVDATRALISAYQQPKNYAPGLRYNIGLQEYRDSGNSGVSAFAVDHHFQLTTWINELTETPCPTH